MHRENTSSPAVRLRPGEGGHATTSAGRPRIAALDVVRGFALCGILLANVQPIAATGAFTATSDPGGAEAAWLGLLVEQRFFPIFSLLFGVGFSLLLDSAAARTARPRVVLLQPAPGAARARRGALRAAVARRHPEHLRRHRPAGAAALDLAAPPGRRRPGPRVRRRVAAHRRRPARPDRGAVPAGLGTGPLWHDRPAGAVGAGRRPCSPWSWPPPRRPCCGSRPGPTR